MSSASVVDWVLLDHDVDQPVQVGDLVSADAGGMPIYQVMALEPGRVLLGDERRRPVRAVSLVGFRWKGGAAHAPA